MTTTTIPWDKRLNLRIMSTDLTAFDKRCASLNIHRADMLREMILAFNDKKLTIKCLKNKKFPLKGVHINAIN